MSALTRTRPAPPVRMVHLGLGNFYRAHQAWYTNRASDAADWGYAAFEGRSNKIAPILNAQDNVYTLAFANADGDKYERIESISRTHAGTDYEAWVRYFESPEVVIASTTITEAGYIFNGSTIDMSNEQFAQDLERLRAGGIDVVSAPARMVAGLRARRAAGVGGMALMSCDNLPDNGAVLKEVTIATARLIDSELAAWIESNVSFVATMVDRITPRVTDDDMQRIDAAIGVHDASPIVAESFGEWVIAGNFPAGRPDWESAGVTFADDVAPHERRKLWMLNGSHSLLAYVGLQRGFTYVDEAIRDPFCLQTVQLWWDDALPQLEGEPTSLRAYCQDLRARYENPRIRYQLAQIGTDGSLKIPVRWVPAATGTLAQSLIPTAFARGMAAFALYVQHGDVRDARRDQVLACRQSDAHATLRALLPLLAPTIADNAAMLAAIDAEIDQFST